MLFSIAMLFILIAFPRASVNGAISGLRLCASSVIPALFPFFIAARLIPQIKCKSLSKLLGLPEEIVGALLVSFLGGYPIGVSRVCAMYEDGMIKKSNAEQAIVFCNNSGPGFFVGMIGGLLCDVRLGLVLYMIHVLSALICVYIFRPAKKSYAIKRIAPASSFAERFTNAVTASCIAMLNVCALVVLFSIFMSVINLIPLTVPSTAKALIFGSLELTSGITLCEGNFVLCAFLMGWGGLCVHLQAMSLWKKQNLTVKNYVPSKLLHGLLSAAFALAWQRGFLFFALCFLVFTVICIIVKNFMKFGVEKKENMLYNTCER